MNEIKTDSSNVQLMCKLSPICFTSTIIMFLHLLTFLSKVGNNSCDVQHLERLDIKGTILETFSLELIACKLLNLTDIFSQDSFMNEILL